MNRVFFPVSAVVIATAVFLSVAAWWPELREVDGRATTWMRREHPAIAGAAKGLGDLVRRFHRG